MKALAYAVVALALLVGVVALARGRPRRGGGPERVPPAMRPAATDDVIETDRLQRIQFWGLVTVVFFAAFVFVYFLAEPGRQKTIDRKFLDNSIRRGQNYFALRTDPVSGKENLAGVECARCHGSDLTGGQNTFVDPRTGSKRTVVVPELRNVFTRYTKPPPGYKDARTFIVATIERGRTDGVVGLGADMPTWSNKYGGPLTEQQIDDIVNYLLTIQGTAPAGAEQTLDGSKIFAQFCATCHGANGTGGFGPAMTGGSETRQFPDTLDHIAFVKSGSTAGKPYGKTGHGTGGMPAWGGTLTDAQIRAVITYERSL